ncbi:hypothetical protein HRbin36_02538 [bacterium HR36]|uniref:RNA-binding region RNP-1 n=1 Tax=uncultured Planctomycetota bacterium TaxID=120965 RepID=H5SCD0_9BACT|nr:RNA-binding region RNP-1 [uncultured Planctomycetota bacterium]GBD37407.1 hypothetical protein HRbin36_02538 [bacterium HR36]
MTKNLYVGNLPFNTTVDELREAFARFGTVTRAQIIVDRDTGRSRGFGFVEMADGADEAIAQMNGAIFQGRQLTVNEARPREERRERRDRRGYGRRGGY